MIKGFRDFVLRGNVVDLAVAVVIGAAFGAVVASLVNDLVMPIVAAIFGQPDFGGLSFTINDAVFRYGAFINAVIAFLLVVGAIYFVVVVPMNKLAERRARGQAPTEATVKQCPECLSEIPVAAKKCAFCASPQTSSDMPAEA
jgi:large conductance mechanosensitive channel